MEIEFPIETYYIYIYIYIEVEFGGAEIEPRS